GCSDRRRTTQRDTAPIFMPRGAVAAINSPRAGQSAFGLIRVHKLTQRPSTATPTNSSDRLIYIDTLPAETLYPRRALNEKGNPREGEGRPDGVSLAHHEISV